MSASKETLFAKCPHCTTTSFSSYCQRFYGLPVSIYRILLRTAELIDMKTF